MEKKESRTIILQRHDQLKHFSRNGPVTKLIALLVVKLPAILLAAGSLFATCAGLAKAAGWF